MRIIKLFTFLILLTVAKFLSASEVPITTAKNTAVNFLSKFTGKYFSSSDISSVVEYKFSGQKVFYAINFKNNFGFVLVSSELAAYPILGFIPNQIFDTTLSMPQSFKNLLSDYARQTIEIRQKNLKQTKQISNRWEDLNKTSVAKGPNNTISPLITSIWSQGCYFNDSTPVDPGGPCMNAVTGCVATAMGQVINYHNFPPRGSGTHSYLSNYGTLTANFGATYYNWALMSDTINSSSSAASVAAVSQLLAHCGISVDMIYSGGSSGAYSEDALNAMIHYFNYSPKMKMLYRDNYSDSIWEQMVANELDSLRPLYYDGSGTGGHAFVCDGYQNNHYFHFNWGWNGGYNGWFLLTNLNPGGMNFGMYNSAFFGTKPQLPALCHGITDTLIEASGSLGDGSSYQNYSNNANCSWLIKPQGATSITLNFYTFDLAIGDTVYIYDGANASAVLLKAITGDSLPSSIASSGGQLFIVFKSDSTINKDGWSASYRSDFCQGSNVLTAPSGQISDGSGSFLYNNNTNCSWLISPNIVGPIHLLFNNFATESGFDFVKIYDGSNANASLLGSFDGHTIPPNIIAQSGQMYISFHSDGGVVDEGWNAQYVVCANSTPPIANLGTSFCATDSVSLHTSQIADSIIWLHNSIYLSNDSLLWTSQPGDYQYVRFIQGCSSDTSQVISLIEYQISQPQIGNDSFFCSNFYNSYENLYLPWDSTAFNYSSYIWNTGAQTKLVYLKDIFDQNVLDSIYEISVIVSDTNGCFGYDTLFIRTEICGGINDINHFQIEVYPNPITDFIYWSSNITQEILVRLYGFDGKMILESMHNTAQGKLETSNLGSGIYFLQFINGKEVYNLRIIKL